MTRPVVQFCFAIAYGDTDRVRELLPKISNDGLFKELNSGVSPALFCLWASQQSPEQISEVTKHLKALYPHEASEYFSKRPSAQNIQAASSLAVPAIKKGLTTLFGTMVSHMAVDQVDNPSIQFTVAACTDALRAILKDDAFDLDEHKRVLATRMLNNFSNFRPIPSQNGNRNRPTVLDDLLEKQKTFLPSKLNRLRLEQRLDSVSKTLREERQFQRIKV